MKNNTPNQTQIIQTQIMGVGGGGGGGGGGGDIEKEDAKRSFQR